MNIKDIPLIIPNYQQFSYLKNLINQFRFYYPENPVVVIDNGSDYQPLLNYLNYLQEKENVQVVLTGKNEFIENINKYLASAKPEYYIISDSDISILPSTPPNFLEVFKTAIDVYGFHHAGFGLKVDDLPEWNPKSAWIAGDERNLLQRSVSITHEDKTYSAWAAPLDTTFCLFKRDTGGWEAPMRPKFWDSSVRIFEAYHLPFYLDGSRINNEMKHYYATCLRRDDSKPSAGRTHHAPEIKQ